jgi:hypothetical protein
MQRAIRAVLWVVIAIQIVLAVAFAFQVQPAIELWPFSGRTPLTNIFIGSIFAAAAASTAWCLVLRSDRGLAGIAIDYITIFAPFAVISFAQVVGGNTDSSLHVAAFGVVSAVGALVGVRLLRWSLSRPWRDPRPTPRLVRGSFVVFIIALLLVSGLLIVQVPDILPWAITPELSTLIGCMFLGASAYFAFGVVDPRWENAGGQLAGFLAYDIVLIVPFIVRLPTIDPNLLPNLIVYTGVLIYSGLLATWYLAIDSRTRGRPPRDS